MVTLGIDGSPDRSISLHRSKDSNETDSLPIAKLVASKDAPCLLVVDIIDRRDNLIG